MREVLVRRLSGEPLCFEVQEDETIDDLRQKVALAWREPIPVRAVYLMSHSGSAPAGSAMVQEVSAEFTAVISSHCPRDWESHAEAIGSLDGSTMNLVFTGDGRCREDLPGSYCVGKTCLMVRFREILEGGTWKTSAGAWNIMQGGCALRFDNCRHEWADGSTETFISMWEAEARDGSDGIEPRRYPKASVFLILFSLVSRESFASIESKWHPEIEQQSPGIPVILVGTKCDLCDDPSPSVSDSCPVSSQEGQALAARLGAAEYVECSSLTGVGLEEVMDAALWACVQHAETKLGTASSSSRAIKKRDAAQDACSTM